MNKDHITTSDVAEAAITRYGCTIQRKKIKKLIQLYKQSEPLVKDLPYSELNERLLGDMNPFFHWIGKHDSDSLMYVLKNNLDLQAWVDHKIIRPKTTTTQDEPDGQCKTGKVIYHTRDSVISAFNRIRSHRNHETKYYHCKHCGFWHLYITS
jgi:hypothetical protein